MTQKYPTPDILRSGGIKALSYPLLALFDSQVALCRRNACRGKAGSGPYQPAGWRIVGMFLIDIKGNQGVVYMPYEGLKSAN